MDILALYGVGVVIRRFHFALSTLPLTGAHLLLVREFEREYPIDYTNPIWARIFTTILLLISTLFIRQHYITLSVYALVIIYTMWKGRKHWSTLLIPVVAEVILRVW